MFGHWRRLPGELLVALGTAIVAFLLNVAWAFSQQGWKIDQGAATLLGAIIGLSIVGRQARLGFRNLVRSQTRQAELDREARLHKANLDLEARQFEEAREKSLLLSAIRAEIAALYSSVLQQQGIAHSLVLMSKAFAKSNVPSTQKGYKFGGFSAPVFRANIPKIGTLGTDLGADVIKVLARADGKNYEMEMDTPIPHHTLEILHSSRYEYLAKWASDLFHVAMRIRSIEENTADPGSLISTENERYAKIKLLDADGD